MKLFRFELRWAETIGRTIAPRGLLGGVVDDVDLGLQFGLECAESPWYIGLLLRASLWLTWLAPIWMRRRLRSFGGLAQAERETVIERLLASERYSVRMAAMYLKLTVCTLLLSDTRALARVGAYGLGGAERHGALRSLP